MFGEASSSEWLPLWHWAGGEHPVRVQVLPESQCWHSPCRVHCFSRESGQEATLRAAVQEPGGVSSPQQLCGACVAERLWGCWHSGLTVVRPQARLEVHRFGITGYGKGKERVLERERAIMLGAKVRKGSDWVVP